jgi:hypothetical protein
MDMPGVRKLPPPVDGKASVWKGVGGSALSKTKKPDPASVASAEGFFIVSFLRSIFLFVFRTEEVVMSSDKVTLFTELAMLHARQSEWV